MRRVIPSLTQNNHMTTLQLEEQLADLKAQRERLISQVQGLNGAISITEHFVSMSKAATDTTPPVANESSPA